MRDLWTFGGLSWRELLRRTIRESWEDAVFGQGGRMAFYHFLALFPSLLVFLVITSRIPHAQEHLRTALQDLSGQVLPQEVTQLFVRAMDELNGRSLSGLQLASVCGGTLWAVFNGTWAMIYGLNRAYEVEENRCRRDLAGIIAGLAFAVALTAGSVVFVIFYSAHLRTGFPQGAPVIRMVEWLVLLAILSLAFSVLYRFAPNLRDQEWRWSTPGALCALLLWLGATFAARIYFDHINNYSRVYGHLNGVAMLLLWLYLTNGAILIGGEMNSEIEKAAERLSPRQRTPETMARLETHSGGRFQRSRQAGPE